MFKPGQFLFGAIVVLAASMSVSVSGTESRADLPEIPSNVCKRGMLQFQQLAYDPEARLSFSNHGGISNKGVCWWHSRLQRAALYLTEFRPELPKRGRAYALWVIDTLKAMDRVVQIPGYRNFKEFSKDYPNEIQARLESWQRSDGFFRFRWIDGLRGHSRIHPDSLKYIMGRIHDMVAVQHRLVFEMLQQPGIDTHAWLIIGSRRTADGYQLDVIDSNAPADTVQIDYRFGDNTLHEPKGTRPMIPYLKYEGDLGRIFGALDRECRARGMK